MKKYKKVVHLLNAEINEQMLSPNTFAGDDVPDEEEANLEEMKIAKPNDKGADELEEKETSGQTAEPTNDPQV
nr:hypothetical protein CFP56_28047 [Quercus suber]